MVHSSSSSQPTQGHVYVTQTCGLSDHSAKPRLDQVPDLAQTWSTLYPKAHDFVELYSISDAIL
ncbi:hypothetical protein PIB30_105810, partial [Stylosanthes scabra]|nr:hypothetical protein [Stylosanthes scabra]